MEYEQLKERHDALLSENASLKEVVNQERAEKQAVDAMFCDSVKQMVQVRKHIILLEANLRDLIIAKAVLEDKVKNLEEKVQPIKPLDTEVPLTNY